MARLSSPITRAARLAASLLVPVLPWLAPAASRAAEPDSSSAPSSPTTRPVASYTMHVRLEPASRILSGSTTLYFTNVTPYPTHELLFHLYYNAWRNDRSSWLKWTRLNGNDSKPPTDDDWAYSRVDSLRIVQDGRERDITDGLAFVQPDDANEHDRTVLRAALPRPVIPGATVEVRFEWKAKVPRTFARTGARGDYFFLAQWFPKIGVLRGDGTWSCHQFIQTEFFADFGTYDVSLTVPGGWIVGATGREHSVLENDDGTATHRYVQADVHDFAWTTSPRYEVHHRRFEHADLPAVDMRLLLMPDHADQSERYFAATAAALRHYGTWWGAYPYGHITIVDPAYGSGAGGMEYPTLFTGGSRWLAPHEQRTPESVTVHEAGHQFWYGMVANDEFEYAWLDEGFNTYTQARVMALAYGPAKLVERYVDGFVPVVLGDVVLPERDAGADAFRGEESELLRDAMGRASWTYGPGSYRINSYTKPALVLRTLEEYFGWEHWQPIVSAYFERWKFRHPRPQDFFAVVNELGGADMSWFFDQIHGDSVRFDYAVGTVHHEPLTPLRGFTERPGGTLELSSPVVTEATDDSTTGDTSFRSTVIVRRWGDGIFPVDVRVSFADGTSKIEHWDGRDRWARFVYLRPARVERVEVDPFDVLRLDVNRTNNSWMSQPPTELASTKWASKWLIEVQYLMELFAYFS